MSNGGDGTYGSGAGKVSATHSLSQQGISVGI